MKFSKRSYVFRFESLNKVEKERWLLGIHLPLKGEQVLKFNYKDAFAGKGEGSGTFYRKLRLSALKNKNSRHQLKLLNAYTQKITQFLKLGLDWKKKNPQTSCFFRTKSESSIKGQCLAKKSPLFDWKLENGNIQFNFKAEEGQKFLIDFSNESDGHYSLLKMFLQEKQGRAGWQNLFEMILKVGDCNQ